VGSVESANKSVQEVLKNISSENRLRSIEVNLLSEGMATRDQVSRRNLCEVKVQNYFKLLHLKSQSYFLQNYEA
jgi:hypothetical protein